MDIKVLLTVLSLVSYCSCAGMLRRTPKVYNALITTDENLTPSRAFPVIQPTIHETGIAHYPYGPYNPYRIFHPPVVHLGSPYESRHIPTFVQQHSQSPSLYDGPPPPTGPYPLPEGSPYETNQLGFPQQGPPQGPQQSFQPHQSFQPQPAHIPQPPPQQPLGPIPQQGYPNYYPQPPQMESNLSEAEQKQDQLPVLPAKSNEKQLPQEPQQPQQPPVPLNEFGLPPSLIPLQSYHPHNPQLPAYPFNTYPLIYDQFNHYHPGQDHYLPHYGYYPPHSYGIPIHRPGKNRPKQPSTPTSTPINDIDPNLSSAGSDESVTEAANSKPQPTNNLPVDNIKNGIENKDKNIPDVPPPPLPAGAKKVQRILAL